jgi:extracellular factor (EF) 3-hydroxypalmitic acid methyl ester biosynthesis protein
MFHCVENMNAFFTNGDNGTASLLHNAQNKAKPIALSQLPPVTTVSNGKDSQITFSMQGGLTLQGLPLSVNEHTVTFELYNPKVIPQISEVLGDFEISLQGQTIYLGRATINNLLDVGTKIICEAGLDEGSWSDVLPTPGHFVPGALCERFKEFVNDWQKSYVIIPEYKLVLTDLQMFLSNLRLWLDRIEAKISSAPPAERLSLEAEAANELRAPVISALGSIFERFELISQKILPDKQAVHRAFGRRLLHPYMLCAPFTDRTFNKPLGYAGDYEMMNMIVRNGFEGKSLFAKLIHSFQVDQAPARAVRGRVDFLTSKIADETGRLSRLGKTANIFCVACGPAWEASNFIAEHPLAEQARFCLLDFNEETLQHTTRKIEEIKKKNHRQTEVSLIKNSVQNLLRAGGRATKQPAEYDLIYCSGLYDYLNDTTCKSLNNHLFDLLRPGGLLVIGNFAPSMPIPNFMEHFLEWFLIYRDAQQMLDVAPDKAAMENCVVRSEPSGTNFFLEARKPE